MYTSSIKLSFFFNNFQYNLNCKFSTSLTYEVVTQGQLYYIISEKPYVHEFHNAQLFPTLSFAMANSYPSLPIPHIVCKTRVHLY